LDIAVRDLGSVALRSVAENVPLYSVELAPVADPAWIDPVCKMQVDENKAAGKSEYNGKTYYFCAPGCKRKFDAEPEKYLKG